MFICGDEREELVVFVNVCAGGLLKYKLYCVYPHRIDDFAVKTTDMLFHLPRLAALYHDSGAVGCVSEMLRTRSTRGLERRDFVKYSRYIYLFIYFCCCSSASLTILKG